MKNLFFGVLAARAWGSDTTGSCSVSVAARVRTAGGCTRAATDTHQLPVVSLPQARAASTPKKNLFLDLCRNLKINWKRHTKLG